MVYTRLRMSVIAGIVFCTASSVLAYSGGSGTSSDPYQIGTVADWNDLMNTQSDWNANFIATADINMQGVPLIPVGNDINGTYIYFRGIFDGNGHVIRNAAITGGYLSTGIGLFGRIDSNSQIRNLGAEDVNMSGAARVGGLVGCSYGTISNCFTTGKVRQTVPPAGTSFGGLVGKNFGTITGSHAACDVNVNLDNVGGLVGWNVGTISDSYANGTVNGDERVGGLVGFNSCAYDEYNDEPDYIGTITRCYATGSATGTYHVGGLVGLNGNLDFVGIPISITNCYAIVEVTGITVAVTGISYVGGLVGTNLSGSTRPPNILITISSCYAAGRVDANGDGLIGPGSVPISANCFWDIEATGQTTSSSGTGLTTAQMKTLSTFTSAGWDFVDTWGIGENQTYPFLRTHSGADLNYDGLVNLIDFALFADRWLAGS
jgi:hypothetical protein